MILFVLYSLGIWTVTWRYRRQWQAFAVLMAAGPPIFLSTYFDMWLVQRLFGEDAGWLLSFAIVFAGVTILIGLLLALQPRRLPEYACPICGYDLRGLGDPRCPECGDREGEESNIATPLAPPVAPATSLAVQLADKRLRDRRPSSQFNNVTSAPPTTTATPIHTQS